ncbi:hypothetical protein SLEP1_g38311 [Rubroshorea leprosula]|uniref:PHD-type domain-containing protein n=1 Tax=Rubroshorea leprosula TaxID=152421 RepID=A0AAV5KXG7_9ROSI|nr:hypothetical protein SLEP1_g38311 [Rubroshorea leprosula]
MSQKKDAAESPQRKIGADGSFFVCVVCNAKGFLLCCDDCPRTYHLECLTPPLEKVPDGDWKCPKCCAPSLAAPNTTPAQEVTEAGEPQASLHKPEVKELKVYQRRHGKRVVEEKKGR